MTNTTRVRSRAWRSRWAAVGAAVAVTLGAGSLVAVNAASSDPSSFVAIAPTRILDTRSDVGLEGPFVSGVSQTLQVTGTVPTQPPNKAPVVDAEVVPATASSVVFNVTVVAPSTKGFLSIRPGDASGDPATSNINWAAGGANIANSVTVQLPTSGDIDIFVNGTVGHVLIDVAGYNVPATSGPAGPAGPVGPAGTAGPVGPAGTSGPADPDLLARIDALEAQVAMLDAREPFAVTGYDPTEVVTLAPEVVVSIAVTAPSAGQVTVNSTTNVDEPDANDAVGCVISENGSADFGYGQLWESSGNPGQYAQMAGTRTFDIVGGVTATYTLVCAQNGDSEDATLRNSVVTAIFTPAP